MCVLFWQPTKGKVYRNETLHDSALLYRADKVSLHFEDKETRCTFRVNDNDTVGIDFRDRGRKERLIVPLKSCKFKKRIETQSSKGEFSRAQKIIYYEVHVKNIDKI